MRTITPTEAIDVFRDKIKVLPEDEKKAVVGNVVEAFMIIAIMKSLLASHGFDVEVALEIGGVKVKA